jgi:type 1 glutamine amidotransferase
MPISLANFGTVWAALTVSTVSTFAADPSPTPLKILFFVGGGYHDYAKLAPHLTSKLSELANVFFVVKDGFESLHDAKFAEGFDAIVYDWCFDDAPDDVLDHALKTTAEGKPTVMIHCAIHAFRRSPKVGEWENCCGMRSKVHDRFEPFTVVKLDPKDPITLMFPEKWETRGDELYQTISIPPTSHQLLKATSPPDGRDHVVCWTCQYHRGLVFGTTLGHDMKTAASPDYLRLLANGLLWTCGKLGPNGKPVAGYAGLQSK